MDFIADCMQNGKKRDAHVRYMGSQEFIDSVHGLRRRDREMVILFLGDPQFAPYDDHRDRPPQPWPRP